MAQAGWSALHFAARNGHAAAVSLLLTSGADQAAVDFVGCTPLHYAAHKGFTPVVKELIKGNVAVVEARSCVAAAALVASPRSPCGST